MKLLPHNPQRSVGPCRGGSRPDRSAKCGTGRGVLQRFKLWLFSLEPGDLAGAATLFSVLFALLCVGGW